MTRFKGKVALVTGCGCAGPGLGNGRAISILLAREGAQLFGCDISLAAAEQTQSMIRAEGGQCEVKATDVAKSDQVEALVNACVKRYNRIDVLVNNVGIGGDGGPVEYPEDKWHRDMDVNVTSMFLTCKYVLPYMERQGGGSIVNISSGSAVRSVCVSSISYDTSKAAVLGFSRAVALRYARKNIRSNVVMPGLINTPMAEPIIGNMSRECPMRKLGEGWDIAEAVAFLASDAAKYITGVELPVDGGLLAKMAIREDFYEEE
jgi:NAD(P)-dependent dehydrogenase (short-subunit alcohol dehydrogenase family)